MSKHTKGLDLKNLIPGWFTEWSAGHSARSLASPKLKGKERRKRHNQTHGSWGRELELPLKALGEISCCQNLTESEKSEWVTERRLQLSLLSLPIFCQLDSYWLDPVRSKRQRNPMSKIINLTLLVQNMKAEYELRISRGAGKPKMCAIWIMHTSYVFRTHVYVCGMHCVWVDTGECTCMYKHVHPCTGMVTRTGVGCLPLLVPPY